MKHTILRKHLAVLIGYSALYWLIMRGMHSYDGFIWMLLMGFGIFVHALFLFSMALGSSDRKTKVTYFLSTALVGLIGFGACTLLVDI